MDDTDGFAGYTRREWTFLLVFTAATVVTWYLTEPVASRVASAVVAGAVVFVTLAVVLRLTGERARQAVLDVVGFLLP